MVLLRETGANTQGKLDYKRRAIDQDYNQLNHELVTEEEEPIKLQPASGLGGRRGQLHWQQEKRESASEAGIKEQDRSQQGTPDAHEPQQAQEVEAKRIQEKPQCPNYCVPSSDIQEPE